MFDTIDILLIACEPVVLATLQNRPDGWPVKYKLKSVGAEVSTKVVSAGAWDAILVSDAVQYADIAKAAKAPLIVLTHQRDYEIRQAMLAAGAARCYSMDLLKPCIFMLHHIVDHVVRERRKDDRLTYLQAAALDELRNLISECSNCHRWRHPVSNTFLDPVRFLESFEIYLTSGLCPECRTTLYGHLEQPESE